MLDKAKAAGVHFLISGVIVLAVALLVFYVWYPSPLVQATGAGKIFMLLLCVDLILGPLLTAIVYRKGKKSLKFDLAVIALVQLAALAYGVWTMAHGRPVWQVFNVDRFDLVQISEIEDKHRQAAEPAFQSFPWFGPQWVASANPQDEEKRNELIFESVLGGADLPQRVDLYQPIERFYGEISARMQQFDRLEKHNSALEIQRELARYPNAAGWLPMKAFAKSMVVLLDRTGHPLGVVDLRPWEE